MDVLGRHLVGPHCAGHWVHMKQRSVLSLPATGASTCDSDTAEFYYRVKVESAETGICNLVVGGK